MSDLFPVDISLVEPHGMSVITFGYLSLYTLILVVICMYFLRELKDMKTQIRDMNKENNSISKELSSINTKMLVAMATLAEKVDNLEQFLKDR